MSITDLSNTVTYGTYLLSAASTIGIHFCEKAGLISSFLSVDFAKLKNIGDASATPMTSFTPTIVIIVTFAVMGVLDFIEKKFNQRWLSSFSLGLSMIVGMAVAVLVG